MNKKNKRDQLEVIQQTTLRALIAWMALITACQNQKRNQDISDNEVDVTMGLRPAEVEVTTVSGHKFNHEIISNGKLMAGKKVRLRFGNNELIEEIRFQNGDYVRKDDTIAIQDNFAMKLSMEKTVLSIQKSELDYSNILLGQGFDPEDENSIDEEAKRLAKIKSGLFNLENELKLQEYRYHESFVIAPFSGFVTNIHTTEGNYPAGSEPFCVLMRTDKMEVDFPVMEGEINLIQRGMKVEVRPYFDLNEVVEGNLVSINPVVDNNGLVSVKATILNPTGFLFDGMNAKISIQVPVDDVVSIPKEAVVMRSEKPVVFKLKNGNEAHWVYVKTGAENSDEVVIKDGSIGIGDTIIHKGNIHLAHLSRVVVLNDDKLVIDN